MFESVREKKLPDSKKLGRDLACETGRERLVPYRVFCYSFEMYLEDVGLTPRTLIMQIGLLILMFWA